VRRQQAGGQEVDGVPSAQSERPGSGDLGDTGKRRLDNECVEVDRALGDERGIDDGGDRLRLHRHVGPEQAFPLVRLHRLEVHDWLELDVVVGAQGEEVVQDLTLGDLGRLVHSDPVAQAGDLDRASQGYHVLLGYRQGRIHISETERGGLRQRSQERLVEFRGPADHTPAGVRQLDDSGLREFLCDARNQPTVSRPKKTLNHPRPSTTEAHLVPRSPTLRWRAPWPGDGPTKFGARFVSDVRCLACVLASKGTGSLWVVRTIR